MTHILAVYINLKGKRLNRDIFIHFNSFFNTLCAILRNTSRSIKTRKLPKISKWIGLTFLNCRGIIFIYAIKTSAA